MNVSIINELNKFFEDNSDGYTRKDLITCIKNAYDNSNTSRKRRNKKKDGEIKEKKPLNAYQLFVKEQMTILKNTEEINNHKELMKKISELWKKSKEVEKEIKKEVEKEIKKEIEKEVEKEVEKEIEKEVEKEKKKRGRKPK